jgi:type VI secretion system protein ImpH
MSSQIRRKNTSITQQLLEAPHKYILQQAVRLLERAAYYANKQANGKFASNPIARFTPPSSESIRLSTNTSLAFPSAEIDEIIRPDSGKRGGQWRISVNAIGLTGAMGVLPYHYTELMLKRAKQKDKTMEMFFDLFNHRTISLFIQAANKYRLPLQYERSRLHSTRNDTRDHHTNVLLSLIGMGTSGLDNRLYTRDESLIYYSGLLSLRIRTASGLRQILSSHFGIPVEIVQFVGQWQDLIDDVRSRLPDFQNPKGRNVCLGRSAMLGKSGWFAQGKIRVILGPLNKQQLQQFSPGTSSLKALHELTRLYVGLENDYEFHIRVRACDFPDRLELNKSNALIIGWNTKLPSNSTNAAGNTETIDISVSSKRLS